MSKIRDRISEDLKQAMKAKDTDRVSTLRMLKTEIVKRETSGNEKDLDHAGLIHLLNAMKKQRLEAIEQYQQGGRQELAQKEQCELEIIEEYLPAELSDEELQSLVKEVIAEVGAGGMKDMGKVMKPAIAKASGRADGKRISAEVKRQLG